MGLPSYGRPGCHPLKTFENIGTNLYNLVHWGQNTHFGVPRVNPEKFSKM